MMKAFSFFAFMFVGTSILVATMSGGSGMSSTQLNDVTGINATDTAIVVDSNVGFSDTGVIWIDNEQMRYTSKTGTTQFNVSVRGLNDTTATSHSDNSAVRGEDNAILNSVFGFNVGQIFDSWGLFAFPIVFVKFFSQTIPYMIQGNMGSLFSGNGLMIIVDMWLVFGAGFVFMLVMALIGARRN